MLGKGIQVVSGFSWAGFNLSSGNFVYDMVAREVIRRPPLLRMVTVVPVQGLYLELVVGMNRTARKFRERMKRIWSPSDGIS